MFDETDDSMTIDKIPRLVNYQRVSVKVKGIGEEDATVVKKGLIKQDYCCMNHLMLRFQTKT